jgi:asparagine synthase (glutamine-hydrolysing)
LFDRETLGLLSGLEDASELASLDSGAKLLIERCWGSFVAFLTHETGCVSVVRDPSGAMACYSAPLRAGGHVVTSDVRACVSLGLIAEAIDWDGVAAYLLWPERRSRRTCIVGVRELMPGSRLVAKAGAAIGDAIWSPWRFTSSEQRIDHPQDAAEEVRAAVLRTVAAWSSRYPRPLVSLSGGLDSSIVMASTPESAGAVTIMTHEALGDERDYAQAVARRCSVDLLECFMDSSSIDPKRSNAAALPRPVSRLFAQELDRIWEMSIAETGADALFHGGGGDNVFCYLASAGPYLDALLAGQPPALCNAVLDSLSRMTRVSRWRIRRAALRKMLIDRGQYRWVRNSRMLSKTAVSMADAAHQHPWFESIPAKTPPGKRAHVAALVRIQNYLEAVEPAQLVPVIAPLMSQPVMEACLRVPTWLWCRDGMNRVVARDAFRSRLPAAVVDRRSKGSPAAFEARMVATRRGDLRSLLRHGHLAARGMIDLEAIDDALGEAGPLRGDGYLRVSELVDVEAWLQSWIGGPSASDRPQS